MFRAAWSALAVLPFVVRSPFFSTPLPRFRACPLLRALPLSNTRSPSSPAAKACVSSPTPTVLSEELLHTLKSPARKLHFRTLFPDSLGPWGFLPSLKILRFLSPLHSMACDPLPLGPGPCLPSHPLFPLCVLTAWPGAGSEEGTKHFSVFLEQ